MSTNRGVQDWISEGLEAALGQEQNVDKWQYGKAFPQLKRCLALMYETLRLYGPVIFIPMYTNAAHQRIKSMRTSTRSLPKTYVFLNSIGLHSMPRYWDSDSTS